jgi:phosphatidylglycerophosphatase A
MNLVEYCRKTLPGFRWTNPVHLLALGFGSGAAPKAPGTFGTVVGVLFYVPFSYLHLVTYLCLLMVMFVIGVYVCGKTAKDLGVHDHGAIVWDEIVGYLITMLFVPLSVTGVLVGFCLFRLFDIWKPWPIKKMDEKIHGGLGIMMDDVAAGIYAMLCMAFFSFLAGIF